MTSPATTAVLNNGIRIPRIGLGSFQIPNVKMGEAIRAAFAAGYRAVDTAAIYGNEPAVGAAVALAGVPRDELFLISKVWNSDQGYDSTLRAYEASLARLAVAHLDLYLI